MTSTASRPRVLLVSTGGTLSMTPGEQGELRPGLDAEALTSCIPELDELAQVDTVDLHQTDSSGIQPEDWACIARTIYERYEDYDGFVVTHGTDTMVYSAAALAFFLQELGKPVVFTGAQIPLTQIGSDGRANLVDAVRVAISELAEVCIVFGSAVLRATRARKTSAFHLQAFESVNEHPLGALGLVLRLAPHARRRAPRRPLLVDALEPDVARIPVWPGMSPDIIRHLASAHAGVLIEGFGVGTLPSERRSLVPAIHEAVEAGVAVVVGTQCVVGSTAMERYEVGRGALEAGAIPAMDMIPEVAQVKLMWALGQTRDLRAVESIMLRSYAGEIELLS
jgi:L-asparaginase